MDIILWVGKGVLRYRHWHTGTRNRQWFGGPGYAPEGIVSCLVRPRSIFRNGTGEAASILCIIIWAAQALPGAVMLAGWLHTVTRGTSW